MDKKLALMIVPILRRDRLLSATYWACDHVVETDYVATFKHHEILPNAIPLQSVSIQGRKNGVPKLNSKLR